jgi:large subunit ribosomal protein L32
MGVPRGRRTKSKQGGRRSHLRLKAVTYAKCPRCGAALRPHYACANCGFYKDRQVIDVFAKLSKRERKSKERELSKKDETAQPETESVNQ